MNLSGSVEQRRGRSQSEGLVATSTGCFAEALRDACLPAAHGEPRLFLQLCAVVLQPPTPCLGVQGLPSVMGTWAWCEHSPEKEQARDSSCRMWKVRLSYWLYWENDSAACKVSVARDGIRALFFFLPSCWITEISSKEKHALHLLCTAQGGRDTYEENTSAHRR